MGKDISIGGEGLRRESCVFYLSWLEAVELLDTPEEQLQLFHAIINYALRGVEDKELRSGVAAAFVLLKPHIDANNRRYRNACKGGAATRELSKLAAKPKESQRRAKGEPKRSQRRAKAKPKESHDATEEAPNDICNSDKCESDKRLNDIVFYNAPHAPTLEEIKKYVTEHNMKCDPVEFFNYYNAVGWRRGNTPITNWQSLLVNWETRGKQLRDEKKKEFEWSPTYYGADNDPNYYNVSPTKNK